MIQKILAWIVLGFFYTIEFFVVLAAAAFVIFAFTGYVR